MSEIDTVDAKAVIRDFLLKRFPGLGSRPFDDATSVLTSGAVDSLGVLDLMGFIEERFGIEISDQDFDPDNFETVEQLARFVGQARR
ncbi:acyl carrier protein [Phreatobacter stygius]|uniref:Acyl carrier protein n=1 Tax=Phreatobacter stygius TaxID=1940610 RepID=A0A4D7B3Z6_9HYPH|nr:acyl carrier protein [Phreatobacter stygius]QCI64376.1 acyl carrier protein [Phreatobacter stygius]